MEGDFIKINKWLLPLSWIYGGVVKARNMLFEIGVLRSRSFRVPVIAVGNITVGGTGKTPHVEYLIEMLRHEFQVAVLSRGYKRKSKGFMLATEDTTMPEIGDEPYQMKQKFPAIVVAVDKNRCHGIDLLEQQFRDLDVVLLDDAFQHRYVTPGVNILLVDYHRLIIYDRLLPAGRLREPLRGKDRADIVIVTKCPKDLKPMEFRVITKAMQLFPYQQLYFTSIDYGRLYPLFDDQQPATPLPWELAALGGHHVLLLSGIASPKQMIHDVSPFAESITPLTFGDHHRFTAKDIARINDTFASMHGPKCIITTEKDATRLTGCTDLSDEVRAATLVLPVRVEFMLGQKDLFNNQIKDYVHKNSRNSILAKAKDDYQSEDSHHTGNRTRTISFRNN